MATEQQAALLFGSAAAVKSRLSFDPFRRGHLLDKSMLSGHTGAPCIVHDKLYDIWLDCLWRRRARPVGELSLAIDLTVPITSVQ